MGLLARALHEALLAERTPRGAQAVAVADADLAPLAVGVARGVVTLAAPLGTGLLLGPRAQLEDLLAERRPGYVYQRALVVVRDALADAVQAGVVAAALQHGVRRVDALEGTDRLDQAREVALDQLVLEREGRGGDHDPFVVEERRDQVGQRLAGAGAGLDQQMPPAGQRGGDGLGHRDLARSLVTAERLDRSGEHVADR